MLRLVFPDGTLVDWQTDGSTYLGSLFNFEGHAAPESFFSRAQTDVSDDSG